MKFKFKVQEYQTEAVKSVVDVFQGQPYKERSEYTLDTGIQIQQNYQTAMFDKNREGFVSQYDEDYDLGFANAKIELSPDKLLENIRNIQGLSNIKESEYLSSKLGAVELDVEMETGTGKTYCYIKTIFELNKKYGFSKFIVIVPSIAIREGVVKSFQMTQDHFMDHYGKKARFFVYNSSKEKIGEIDNFSSSNAINVMIINIQAFNSNSKENLRIYKPLDEFQSRRPIDVIAKNKPILILDEPQKMSGEATQDSLKKFNPLFTINYSATHKVQHNLVYVLDALDAFNKKLVKKIIVKGFTMNNLRGTNGYMYVQDIVVSPDKPPRARIEIERLYKGGRINRETFWFEENDNIYQKSYEMEQYNGLKIRNIDPESNTIELSNGETLVAGNAYGEVSEKDIRRIQIRETIKSHFENEEELFNKGIKVLSLFFIDEVAKYRQYDEDGNEINGVYGQIFEQEYNKVVNEYINLFDTPYVQYLKKTESSRVHKGYFSIDKRGRKVDSTLGKNSDISDDVSAYDLILKDKERLLSFEEPTRFIFSHSALREGWDNPNVFQICTLKHSSSDVQRRQEVGRGLRLCVNSSGDRMDATMHNFDVHSINRLTVVANESYEDFVKGLQTEIKETLYDRPSKASVEYFAGKKVVLNGEEVVISSRQARGIYQYLIMNQYIDMDEKPTEKYRQAVENNTLEPMMPELEPLAEPIHKWIQAIYDESVLGNMITNGNQPKVQDNRLNENFKKKEFQNLWKLLNHKYAYTVKFDSEELIKNSIAAINKDLSVTKLTYTVSTGEQKNEIDREQIINGVSFKTAKTKIETITTSASDDIKYDLLGKVAGQTSLTRKTVATILKGIEPKKFILYHDNPEEFINKTSKIINEQKASIIVEHITYNEIDGEFDVNIFNEAKSSVDFKDAYKSSKHIKDYVFVDGINKTNSVERRFAEDLDGADEVVVYAKLPRTFYIPTPMGHYSPDWAIAFKEGSVKHVYFVAETKGSLDSAEFRGIERAKIECADKLFNKMSSSKVKYQATTTYSELIKKIKSEE